MRIMNNNCLKTIIKMLDDPRNDGSCTYLHECENGKPFRCNARVDVRYSNIYCTWCYGIIQHYKKRFRVENDR